MKILSILCPMLISCLCFGMDNNPDQFKIDVQFDESFGCYYTHQLSEGQNLFQISQWFGVPQDHILDYNPQLDSSLLKVGQSIKIPIQAENIQSYSSENALALYYTVKPKETMFRISRIYFKKTIEEIQRLNDMEDHNLSIGQKLLIGWLPIKTELISQQSPVQASFAKIDLGAPVPAETKTDVVPEEEVSKTVFIRNKNAIAYWHKSQNYGAHYFVLHRTAKINSTIEIINPMFNRSITARVLGRIPENVYPDDVDIIVSARIAKELGALDPRFYVQLSYQR